MMLNKEVCKDFFFSSSVHIHFEHVKEIKKGEKNFSPLKVTFFTVDKVNKPAGVI